MEHKQRNQGREQSAQGQVLSVAFELANSTWKMACSDGSRLRHVTVTLVIWPKSKERFSEPSGISPCAARCTR